MKKYEIMLNKPLVAQKMFEINPTRLHLTFWITWTAMELLVSFLYCATMIPPVTVVYMQNGAKGLGCGWAFVFFAVCSFIASFLDFVWEVTTFKGEKQQYDEEANRDNTVPNQNDRNLSGREKSRNFKKLRQLLHNQESYGTFVALNSDHANFISKNDYYSMCTKYIISHCTCTKSHDSCRDSCCTLCCTSCRDSCCPKCCPTCCTSCCTSCRDSPCTSCCDSCCACLLRMCVCKPLLRFMLCWLMVRVFQLLIVLHYHVLGSSGTNGTNSTKSFVEMPWNNTHIVPLLHFIVLAITYIAVFLVWSGFIAFLICKLRILHFYHDIYGFSKRSLSFIPFVIMLIVFLDFFLALILGPICTYYSISQVHWKIILWFQLPNSVILIFSVASLAVHFCDCCGL